MESSTTQSTAANKRPPTLGELMAEVNAGDPNARLLRGKGAGKGAGKSTTKGKGKKTAEVTPPAADAPTLEVSANTTEVQSSAVEAPEAPAAADVKPEEPKKAQTRTYFGGNIEARLTHNLGDTFEGLLLFTNDPGLSEDDKKLRAAESRGLLKGLSVKQRMLAEQVFMFAVGRKSDLRDVIRSALELVITEGSVTAGKDGSLFKRLVGMGKTASTAGTQTGPTVDLLVKLAILGDGPKHAFRPDSALAPVLVARLGAVPAKVEASTPVQEAEPAPTIEVTSNEPEPIVEPVVAQSAAPQVDLGSEIDKILAGVEAGTLSEPALI